MLTQYTKYDEIRAAIGVAEEEITDAVLSLPNYELVLQFDLEELLDVTPNLDEYYLSLIPSGHAALSVNEKRFVSIMQVYAAYVIARHLLGTIEMFAPKTVKDSKTQLDRIDDPYSATKDNVNGFYALMRGRLLAAYGVLFPLAPLGLVARSSPLLAVGLSIDPVTGV